jgi:predicted amidohydrolase
MKSGNIKIGIGQFSSVHLDLQRSLQKSESIIREAAKYEVKFLVMGETWLSEYPARLIIAQILGDGTTSL